jgi:methionine synthase II (cobalamin-independent)
VQLDAPHYPLLVDRVWQAFYQSRGWSLQEWLARGIEFDNAVIDAAPGVTFGFHLCRGNQGSRWLVSGGYEAIARPIFQNVRAHRLLLEYDDERSGGFEPLEHVRDDQVVVLGLVTTKTPRVETRHAVRLLNLDRRQRDHRGRRAPQARHDRGDGSPHLGMIPAPNSHSRHSGQNGCSSPTPSDQ